MSDLCNSYSEEFTNSGMSCPFFMLFQICLAFQTSFWTQDGTFV